MTSWYDEPILHERDILLLDRKTQRKEQFRAEMYKQHPENFELFGLDIRLKSDQSIHVISFHNGVWLCTCSNFQATCGHVMAVEMLLQSAFNPSDSKMTLAHIQIQLGSIFDGVQLAKKANIHPIVIQNMLSGFSVAKEEAEQVLTALSHMTGRQYSLDNVKVALIEPEHHEDAQLQ